MNTTTAPYRSTRPAGRDGFAQIVRGEWTKFRTVRGWVAGTAVAAVLMVAFGFLAANGSHSSVNGAVGHPFVPTGPGGEAVTDSFYLAHQPLDGDGSITARVSSLTGGTLQVREQADTAPTVNPDGAHPWAKAGLIIKASTSQGSAYAAVMVTPGHGVRMQYNYTGDIAGPAGAATPRWLRLTRAGNAITGYASTDGTTWTTVGTVHLAGLAANVTAGMFVASPGRTALDQSLGSATATGQLTAAIATFDAVDLTGGFTARTWSGMAVGASDSPTARVGRFQQAGGVYTVTGSGDIAPDVDSGSKLESTLVGGFAALTVLVVLAVLFITTEYRRGLIRTSLTICPRRGRVLAAKAVVTSAVTFVTGLVAAAVTVPLSSNILRANGNFVFPVTALTEVRVIAGTAALLAIASVLALAVGTIVRRGAAAVATVIVLMVLPYILATAHVLPIGPSQWLLRITPAAAFAIQQSLPAYPQVDNAYPPALGFFPLSPWTGFAVLCAWTALALAAAMYLLRRRDV